MVIVGFLAIALSYIVPASVFSLSMLCLNLLVGSIGVAMTTVLFSKKTVKSESIMIAVAVGVISTLLWKYLGAIAGVSEGVVGYVLGLVTYIMLNNVFKFGKK